MEESFRIEKRDTIGQFIAEQAIQYTETRIKQHGCSCVDCQRNIRLDVINGTCGTAGALVSVLFMSQLTQRFNSFADCKTHSDAIAQTWMRDLRDLLHDRLQAEECGNWGGDHSGE